MTMDLLRIIEAARRHWLLMAIGASVGVIVAVITAYKVVSTDDGMRVAPRTAAIYETRTRLLITEPNLDVARMSPQQSWPTGYTKTIEMAPTYALLVVGDEVRAKAEDEIGPLKARVSAAAVEKTPIIVLKASGREPQATVQAARAMTTAFTEYLTQQQDRREIAEEERVKVVVLTSPTTPLQTSSGTVQVGALAFLAPLLASLALAVSLDGAERRRSRRPQANGE